MKKHITAGTDVNAKMLGNTALHWAAYHGRKEIAELLITAGADMNAQGSISGWTPLHFAARWGHKEIAELLIAAGADVNAKGFAGKMTPLDVAIAKNTPKSPTSSTNTEVRLAKN